MLWLKARPRCRGDLQGGKVLDAHVVPSTNHQVVQGALAFVAFGLRRQVAVAVAPFALKPRFAGSLDELTVNLEACSPDLLLIDTDLVGYPDEVCRLAHRLDPATKVVGISCYWSERDALLRTCRLDGILHKPLRSTEWNTALEGLGLESVAIPAVQSSIRTDAKGRQPGRVPSGPSRRSPLSLGGPFARA